MIWSLYCVVTLIASRRDLRIHTLLYVMFVAFTAFWRIGGSAGLAGSAGRQVDWRDRMDWRVGRVDELARSDGLSDRPGDVLAGSDGLSDRPG
jgi:hypothetical protein